MRAKVVIENGESKIVLTPENGFETHILEECYSKKQAHNMSVIVDAEYSYGQYQKHKLEISIKEIRP